MTVQWLSLVCRKCVQKFSVSEIYSLYKLFVHCCATPPKDPGGWASSLKNSLNLTINQLCLSWHGVILAGLQMCRRWVGLAHFQLSTIQRLMATSQGSAAGSDKGHSAVCQSSLYSLIWWVCFNSFPSSVRLQGCQSPQTDGLWKSGAFFFTGLNRGVESGDWWRGGERPKPKHHLSYQ